MPHLPSYLHLRGFWYKNLTFTIFAPYLLLLFFLQRHICKEKICANPFWVCGILKVIYSSQAFMVSLKGYSLMLYVYAK